MADAFLLGAGFSKAISPEEMPLTAELGLRVISYLSDLHELRIERHSSICDGISCDWPVLIDREPPTNFEPWLSSLAEPQPHLSDSANDRNHALFIEMTAAIAIEIERSVSYACHSEPPEWLANLVATWHSVEASVVTLNYDTLIEATVEWLNLPGADPRERLSFMHIGPSVVKSWETMYAGHRLRPVRSFRYWKLHGSTHWYWDERTKAADSIVHIGLPNAWGTYEQLVYDDEEMRFRALGKSPLIVPPTATKAGFFDNPVIRFLWQDAFQAVRGAERLFVMGYSLPHEDLLVRSMLRDCISGQQVWVVDPSPNVLARFEALCGVGRVDDTFCGSWDCVSRFVEWYGNQT